MTEHRASFDAGVTFLNGGDLHAQGFRLDIPDAAITEEQLAELFVRHLGLLMVDQVRLENVKIIAEPHKGSRGAPADRRPPQAGLAALVELNHVVTAGMTTYPGLPGPEISAHLTREESRRHYAPGTEFAIDRITLVGNTGTYLDSPYHRYADGDDLSGIPLSAVADLPVVVIRVTGSGERGIGPRALAARDVADAAVLLQTGWDRHWGSEAYGVNAPYLTEDGAHVLAEAGARLVGIDSVNIDDASGTTRPAHSILLRAGIPILEHLTGLGRLPITGARLHAAPVRIRSVGTFPVRAYAVVPQ